MRYITKFFNLTPSFYAISYLLSIPIFATLYASNIEGFYQSTVQQEGTILLHENRTAKLLEKYIESMADSKNEKYLSHKCNYITKEKISNPRTSPLNISVSNLELIIKNHDSIVFTFDFYLKRIDRTSRGNGDLVYSTAKRQATVKLLSFSSNYSRNWYSENPMFFKTKNIDTPRDCESSLITIFPTATYGKNTLLVQSEEIFQSLAGYQNAILGKPTHLGSSFIRMLYFSTITITTLGFGDIVPLTDATRILVSIESILGVILIGLFLNSLSTRNK